MLTGAPMYCGSRFFAGFVPEQDSELMRHYKACGVVIVGKTRWLVPQCDGLSKQNSFQNEPPGASFRVSPQR